MKQPRLAFLLVACAPFVITMCTREVQKPTDTPEPSATPAANPTPTPDPTPTTDPTPTPTPDATPPPPAYKGPIPSDCAGIEAALARSATRACKSDAECGSFAMQCGCPQPVAVTALPKLNALEHAYEAKDCFSKSPTPRPCATCAMPPPRKCVSGQCQ